MEVQRQLDAVMDCLGRLEAYHAAQQVGFYDRLFWPNFNYSKTNKKAIGLGLEG